MSSENHEDDEVNIHIISQKGMLNIRDGSGLSLLPDNLKIDITVVKNITINQRCQICEVTGKCIIIVISIMGKYL